MSRWTALALVSWALAVACGIVAVTLDGCTIEGAYFDRSVGAPADAGVFDGDLCGFDVENPYVWAAAAIPFALMGTAVFVLSRVRRR